MPWDPALQKALPVQIEILNAIESGEDAQEEQEEEPITEETLAAYHMPKFNLPGFEEQDAIVRQLREEGKLFGHSDVHDVPQGKFVIDPVNGMGMPGIPD